MPHAVLEGPITIEDVWLAAQPVQLSEAGLILKIQECYLAKDKTELLVRAFVSEKGHNQKFFVRLYQREGGVTIKLEPFTDPEKTAGVQRLLGVIAERILASCPEARVAQTNIASFIRSS